MAPELTAARRAYEEIRQAIISGALKQRERLDIDELARAYRVSATPVRHALAVLTSERLIVGHSVRGYHVAFWSEAELTSLYEWRSQLAGLAVDTLQSTITGSGVFSGPYEQKLLACLRALDLDANLELRVAAKAADDRLIAAYRAEEAVLASVIGELGALCDAIADGGVKRLRRLLKNFYKRRIASVSAIRARAGVNALPRNGD
jgi:DNA-binding transcriptional regulator YhcF (GntR family)